MPDETDELSSLDVPGKRAFFIWGFLQEFFSFNFDFTGLLDLTPGKFLAKSWAGRNGKASWLNLKPEKTTGVENGRVVHFAKVSDLAESKTSHPDAVVLDCVGLTSRELGKGLKAIAALADRISYVVVNETPALSSELKDKISNLGFYPVKGTYDSFLEIDLVIYAKNLNKYASIAGAYEVSQVIALEKSSWYRVKTCVKGKEQIYLKLAPSEQERQNHMRSCVCHHVPPVVKINSGMMVLTDVGALPLRFLGGWKNFNREIVYRQATSALEELHSQGIIHGNISKDTVWVNPDDSSAWIMCFGNAVVNGQGWTSFHSARWGRAQTSKIDFQGLAEAFSQ